MDTLLQLYKDYHQEAQAARKKSTIIANFLGSAGSAQNHPCHEKFYQGVGAWLKAFAATEPDGEQVMAVCQLLLHEPVKYKNQDCYWFMYACIHFVEELMESLSREQCGELAQLLAGLYKKADRMPAQEKLFKALCKKAGLDSRRVK